MKIKNKTLWIGLSSAIVGLPIATIVSCENNSSKLSLAMKSIEKVINEYKNGKNRILLTKFGSNNKSTTRVDEITEKNLDQWFENLPPIANAKNDDGVTFYLRSVGAKGTSGNDKTTLEIKWIATKDNVAEEMTYTEDGFLASDAPVIKNINAEKDSTGKVGIIISGANLPIDASEYKITKKNDPNAIGGWNARVHDANKVILEKMEANLSGELTISFVKYPSIKQNVMITEIKTIAAIKDADGKVTITIEGNGLPTKETDFEIKKVGAPEGEIINGWKIEGQPSSTQVVLSKTDDALTGELTVTLVSNPTVNKNVTIELLKSSITKVSAEKNSANEIGITIEGTNLPSNVNKYKITKKGETTDITGWTISPHGDGKFVLKKTDKDLSGELTISLVNDPTVTENVTIVEIKSVIVEKNNDGSIYIAIEGNGLPIVANEFEIKKAGSPEGETIDGWQIEGTASPTKVILKKDNESSLNINDNLEIGLVNNPTINRGATIQNNDFKINHATGELIEYTGTSKEIVIPAIVNGHYIKKIGNNVFNNKGITKLTFASGSIITSIGNFAFANNEISGLLDLSHLSRLNNVKEEAFSNNKISELKFSRILFTFGDAAFKNNQISKVNSDVEGEFRFYNGSIFNGEVTNTSLNNNVFVQNKIKIVFLNENVKDWNGTAFDSSVQKIMKTQNDYDENGVLINTTIPNPPTPNIVNWLRKRLTK